MKTIPDWKAEAARLVRPSWTYPNQLKDEAVREAIEDSVATALRDAYRRGQADQRDAEPRVAETPVTEGRCEYHCALCGDKGCSDCWYVKGRLCSCRVAGGKSVEVQKNTDALRDAMSISRHVALDEAIAVVEKNGGDKTVLAALRELANR